MNEVKATLKRMAFYYLLLVLNIIPNANIIPDNFPTRNISTIYLLTLSVGLVLYYSHRVSGEGRLSVMMKALSWMALLMILLRGIKYSASAEVGVLARHMWYLYYVPMLLLPLFLLYISLLVSPKKDFRIPKGMYFTLALTAIFIVLVLTNDFHQLVFKFQPDFLNWDNDYAYGKLFYVINIWQYALYIAAIVILTVKCRISSSKKSAWVILLPLSAGVLLSVLLVTEKMPKINGAHLFEVPETLIFTAAAVLECCMQLGLIPVNTDYGKLFRKFSIFAQITDEAGNRVYSSYSAVPLTEEQFAMQSGARISEHTALYKMKIPSGFGFWQDDMSELDRLNDELAAAKEELAQEAELIRLRSELKQKQLQIEQRTRVYDNIAKRTQRQSQLISQYAERARLSDDIALKEECRGKVLFLGAYIKRFANLMLLSHQDSAIEAGELGLSVSEVLRYLNFCSIPVEFFGDAGCIVSAQAALAVFEAFETLLEINLDSLRGVFVNLSEQETLTFKINLEGLSEGLPSEAEKKLLEVGVTSETDREDDVTYICFTMPEGGETL